MRTTVDIDDALLAAAKSFAVKQHRSVRSLIEEGLQRVLQPGGRKVEGGEVDLPVSRAQAKATGKIDVSASLRALIEAEDIERYGHAGR